MNFYVTDYISFSYTCRTSDVSQISSIIPFLLKYTYTLPDSACTQVTCTLPDSACWKYTYSLPYSDFTQVHLYLIPIVLKYTYTQPDSACAQVNLYLIALVLKYTYTLHYSSCTQVHQSTLFLLYSSTPLHYLFRLYYNLSLLTPQSTIIRQAIWTSQHTRTSESVGCTEWPVAGRHSLGLSLTNVLSASFFIRIKVDCYYYYYWL